MSGGDARAGRWEWLRTGLLLLVLLPLALAAEEGISRAYGGELGQGPIWTWLLPWAPIALVAALHGVLATTPQLYAGCLLGSLWLTALDGILQLAGLAQGPPLARERPLLWLAVSLPLWGGLLLITSLPAHLASRWWRSG
jgi:hypothetical protein